MVRLIRPVSPTALRNRLLIASSMWREETGQPLPRLDPGEPEQQIEIFELALVDWLFKAATPDDAGEQADKMWQLVHDRQDSDPVKQRVVAHHEALAKLSHGRDPFESL